MITFSVITVTYNAGAHCERTFHSVSEQTYPRVEHLIIDGASTDHTLQLARAYQEQQQDQLPDGATSEGEHHTVKIFSEPDNGLYDAMNKGIRQATGDYIVFLNAGDVFPLPSTLEQISDALAHALSRSHAPSSSRPAVLYGDTDVVDSHYHVLHRRRGDVPDNLSWQSFLQGMLVCHQAFYARTDLARETPYNLHYRYSADVDWCIRIMKKAAEQRLTLLNVHAVIAYFMEGGMTTVHHRESLKERFRVMVTHYGLVATVLSHIWFVIKAIIPNRPNDRFGIIAKARTL